MFLGLGQSSSLSNSAMSSECYGHQTPGHAWRVLPNVEEEKHSICASLA